MVQQNNNKMKNGRQSYILLYVVLAIVACASVYTYTDYLYGVRALDILSAYWDGNYCEENKLHNGKYYTKNSERVLAKTKIGLKYYPNERICTENNTSLGKDSTGVDWLKTELGPIPFGEKISSYEMYGSGLYVCGRQLRTLIYRDWEHVIGDNGFLIPVKGDVIRRETKYVPIYKKHKIAHCFSTFDISNQMSFFKDKEDVYNDLLDDIKQSVVSEYDINPIDSSIHDYRVIIYNTHDDVPLRRVIFCANERMYILETKSTHNIAEISNRFCSNLSVEPVYKLENEWYRNVTLTQIILFAACFLAILFSYLMARKEKVVNKVAKTLSVINIILLIPSCYLLHYFIGIEYKEYYCRNPFLVSAFSISIVINTILIVWLISKTSCKYSVDWAVLPFLKKHCYYKINREVNRRLYLSFVLYPVIVFCATPVSVYVILYGIAMTLVVKTIIYLNNWGKWLNEGNEPEEKILLQDSDDSLPSTENEDNLS